MSIRDCGLALIRQGNSMQERIVWNIRLPRILAAMIAGAGLSMSGLVMQTVLNNPMASPSTLGVSHAAVFGANLSIIVLAGGYLSTGNNLSHYTLGMNPYSTSTIAFLFSLISSIAVLGMCRRSFLSPHTVALLGITMGYVWTAATTILQFYATDVGLSAAVIWSFGDLSRATYRMDLILFVIVAAGGIVFWILSWQYNVLLSGDMMARSVGISPEILRGISLLFTSVITAACVSFLGIIGFVGVICPHTSKKIAGQDHRISLPLSMLCGSSLLLLADTLSRSVGNGASLPAGAITSLLGAPFFLMILLEKKEGKLC